MSAGPSQSSPSAAYKEPRVGVAVFLVDDRNYILIGKRKGSNGSGTLALPGGHLDWQESFEDCAARELLEETGIDVRGDATSAAASSSSPPSPIEYLTLMNVRNLKDPGDTDEGKHYVTIFMKARVTRTSGQQEVPALVMEPNKCDGWVWVPLNYLFSRYEAQASLQRYESSAKAQGDTLGVPLDRLILAERIGQQISGASERTGDYSNARTSATAASERRGGIDPDRLQPRTDEEIVAFALADDLAQGASLFRPLGDLLREQGDLLRREFSTQLSTSPRPGPATSAQASPAAAPQLPPSIFSDDATTVINDALRAPPHLKHSLTLQFPAPTPQHAEQIASILRVDKPLRPYDTTVVYTTQSTIVKAEIKTSTVRLLRLCVNAVLEDVSLVVKTMEAFPGPLRAHELEALQAGTSLPPADAVPATVFEEGTVGTVQQIKPVN